MENNTHVEILNLVMRTQYYVVLIDVRLVLVVVSCTQTLQAIWKYSIHKYSRVFRQELYYRSRDYTTQECFVVLMVVRISTKDAW